MALQVWLPLNGNLKNKGCADVTITNNGATVDNNGKIGQCYSFNGTTNEASISGLNFSGASQVSISVWLCPTTANVITAAFEIASNTYWQIDVSGKNLEIRDTSTGLTGTRKSYNMGDFPAETWTHLVVTYDSGEVKIYKNGSLFSTQNTGGTKLNDSLNIYKFGRSYNQAYRYKGKLNDLRIYDHCLSAAEVKEISRGLVLHYKLDTNHQVLNNVFTNPTFNTSSANGGWAHWAQSESRGTYSQNTDTNYIFDRNQIYSHKVSCTKGKYYICYQSPAFKGGYRSAQAIIKLQDGEVPDTSKIRWGANALVIAPTTKFTHLRDGFYLMKAEGFNQDGSDDLVCMQLFPGTTVYISEAYLENNKKLCSDLFNQNSNIEYDSSGYGNHGTITGTLDLSNDTIRYEGSALFNGVDSCITVPYKKCNPDGIFTMNLWFKKDLLGTKNYETLFGGPSGFEMDTRSGSASTLSLYMDSVRGGNVFSPFNFGEWYMVTMVRDGTNEMYYINGELAKTIAAKSMPNGTYFIGAWQTEVKQNYYGLISDFRIYATALSADDIKQLYEVSAKIDNYKNVECYQICEETTNPKIFKTGNIKVNEFKEFEELDELQYITYNGSQYIDTGIVLTNPYNIEHYVETQFANTVNNFETVSGFKKSSSIVTPRYGIHKYQQKLMIDINKTNYNYSVDTTMHELVFTTTNSTQTLYVDGTYAVSSTISANGYDNNSLSLFLGARNQEDRITNYFSGNIGKSYLTQNGVLLYDYVPCINKNGVVGMYDKVSNTFITSANSQSFVAGPKTGEKVSVVSIYPNSIYANQFIEI